MARLSEDWMTEIVQQELDALSQQIRFIAFAVQPQGKGAYSVLAKGDRGQGVRITVGIGDTFPFSAPAIMRAFHAWSDPAEVDRLVAQFGLEEFTADDGHRPRHAARGPGPHPRGRATPRASGSTTSASPASRHRCSTRRAACRMVVCSLAFASELNESNVDHYGELIRECGLRITERTGGAAKTAG